MGWGPGFTRHTGHCGLCFSHPAPQGFRNIRCGQARTLETFELHSWLARAAAALRLPRAAGAEPCQVMQLQLPGAFFTSLKGQA